MSSLFEDADAMYKRPGFSEADLAPMFRQLRRHWLPNYSDDMLERSVMRGTVSLDGRNRINNGDSRKYQITIQQKAREGRASPRSAA